MWFCKAAASRRHSTTGCSSPGFHTCQMTADITIRRQLINIIIPAATHQTLYYIHTLLFSNRILQFIIFNKFIAQTQNDKMFRSILFSALSWRVFGNSAFGARIRIWQKKAHTYTHKNKDHTKCRKKSKVEFDHDELK